MNEDTPKDQTPAGQPTSQQDNLNHSLPITSSGMRSIEPLPTNQSETPATPTELPVDPAETASETTEPLPTEPVASSPVLPANPDPHPERPKVDISAIYPDNTPKLTDGIYQKPGEPAHESVADDDIKKTKTIVLVTSIFGGLVIADALLTLVLLIRVGVSHASIFKALDLLIIGGDILLGVGLMVRKELARLIYLVFSALAIISAVINIALYVNARQVESQNTKNFIAQEQRLEAQYRDSNVLTAAQKQELIAQIQTQERILPNPQKNTHLLYTPIAELIVPVAAVVFLTRPGVKKQFK